MKRFFLCLLCLLLTAFCLLAPQPAQAVGTVTVSVYSASADRSVLTIKLACTGDSSNGSVPATAITDAALFSTLKADYSKLGYYLYEVKVVNGSPSPTAANISIADTTGILLYSETGVIPVSGVSKYGTFSGAWKTVSSALTVTTAGQTTASAKWDIYITLAR